ncbi:Xanthoxin dehydrogenase [Triticum urartu]|uniref:Xanthoxin dehydrogenase n=1 Tax=Triticum urartu TaxID=4572 RepID=M7ZNM6_TRIUA|nr:Xanthoxin dehydrogenase [Triticum urartu]
MQAVLRAANAGPAVAGIKHAARVMVPRRSGCIICTASTAGVLGGIIAPTYGVSKAAVIGAVRAFAGELGRHGVRVNAISPHGIATQFGLRGLAQLFPEAGEEEMRRMVEAGMNEMGGGTVLEVEDIARAAVYLASDEAKYVNGHNLVVDGGCTVWKGANKPAPAHGCEAAHREEHEGRRGGRSGGAGEQGEGEVEEDGFSSSTTAWWW